MPRDTKEGNVKGTVWNSPDLNKELTNAIIGAFDAHSAMSTKALNDEKVRAGIMDKPDTPNVQVGGWCQGAALKFGKGRVALFGEAAMFSAQITGPNRIPVGMNSPDAPENAHSC